jgi:hypothetical protein
MRLVIGCPLIVPDTFRLPFTYNFANVVLFEPIATLEMRNISVFGPKLDTFDHCDPWYVLLFMITLATVTPPIPPPLLQQLLNMESPPITYVL